MQFLYCGSPKVLGKNRLHALVVAFSCTMTKWMEVKTSWSYTMRNSRQSQSNCFNYCGISGGYLSIVHYVSSIKHAKVCRVPSSREQNARYGKNIAVGEYSMKLNSRIYRWYEHSITTSRVDTRKMLRPTLHQTVNAVSRPRSMLVRRNEARNSLRFH